MNFIYKDKVYIIPSNASKCVEHTHVRCGHDLFPTKGFTHVEREEFKQASCPGFKSSCTDKCIMHHKNREAARTWTRLKRLKEIQDGT